LLLLLLLLQILSNNTRRTKVVELSTGTHRVPDELRKHYLSDGEGGQYSTNLDRNRYGNDDQYLFTGGQQQGSSQHEQQHQELQACAAGVTPSTGQLEAVCMCVR
jgi:hypothetical protein